MVSLARAGLLAPVLGLAVACANASLGDAADADPGAADGPVADAARGDAGAGAADANGDAAPADACVADWQPLLTNGTFEAGRTVWTEDTGGSANAIIRQEGAGLPFNAANGAWAALVLGYNSADVTLSQTVTVPADATMLRLVGQRCWVTTETAGANDTMSITLRDTGGALLETLASLSNADADPVCSWLPFEYPATDSFAGQSVALVFDALANGTNPTSFGLDDLRLEAYACP